MVSVDSLALLSYLLPEQSFVQVSVHGMCALAAYDALHSPSLRRSSVCDPPPMGGGVVVASQSAMLLVLSS